MTYRDDDDALRAYRDDLEHELARLATQVADLSHAEREQRRVASELDRVRTELDGRARQRAPVRLEELRVASPCRESWEKMTGDDLVRHCGKCDRLVFDLSQMSTEEAEILVSSHSGARLCTRMWRRADGKVMTQDCPDRGRQRKIVAAVAASVLAAGAGAAAFAATLVGAHSAGQAVGAIAMPAPELHMGDVQPAPPPPPPPKQHDPSKEPQIIMGGMPAPPRPTMGHMAPHPKTDPGK